MYNRKIPCRPHRTCFFVCQKNSESFYIAKSYINNEGKSTSVNVRKLGTLKELLIKHGPHTLYSTMPDIPYFRSLFPYHYYNILMGNPLTSSKDLSVLGAGLKTSVNNEFDIVYGGFCFIPSLSLYQTLG